MNMKNRNRIRVLVADNSEFAKRELRDFLQNSHEVELVNVVDNGKDAYRCIIDEVPDVVLIDVILPVMDGFTVIEKTNGNKSLRKKPSFIIVSSMGNQSMVEYACKLGVLYYMMKPYNLESMLHRIFQGVISRTEKERYHSMQEYGMAGYMEKEDYLHAFHMGISAGSASAFSENLATKEEIQVVYKQVTEG